MILDSNSTGKRPETIPRQRHHELNDYTPFSPIDIENNSAFTYYGFAGNGTPSSPYIISNLNITSSTTPIAIRNTDANFIIENCWLMSLDISGSTVILYNITNGVIANCIAYASPGNYVLSMQQCNSSEVSGNEINTDFEGLYLYDCRDVLLLNNTIESAMYGISVHESWDCYIFENFIRQCDRGIRVFYSYNVSIETNRLFENSWGAYIQDSYDCRVVGNIVVGNLIIGIELFGSATCFVYGNNVTANSFGGGGGTEAGIYLFNTNYSSIEANYVIDGSAYGIHIGLHSTGNSIFLNNITWNSWGEGYDNGYSNTWDDGISIGNRWGDYNGTGMYYVEGMAGSVDRFPEKYDWTPPAITLVNPPITVPVNQPATITALVEERILAYVILSYRVGGGTWHNLTMNSLVEGFVATIPGQPVPTNVEFIVMALDNAGNWGTYGGDYIVVAEIDTTSPDIISWRYPWFPMPGQVVSVTANVTDFSGIESVILEYYVDGVNPTNLTMSSIGADLYQVSIPGLPNETLVEYRIYASDLAGNWGVTGMDTYTVTDEDLNGPDILDVYFWPENPTEIQSVEVNATIEDYSGVAEAFILWFLENSTWGEVPLIQDVIFWTGFIPPMPAGTVVTFGVHARDILDNWNNAGNYTYVVAGGIEGPYIDVDYWPEVPTEHQSVTVVATISDPDGVADADIIYLLEDEYGGSIPLSHEAGTWSGAIPAQPAGTNVTFWVYAIDNLGYGNSAGNFTYTVVAGDDQEGPEISVTFTPEHPNQYQSVAVAAIIEDSSGVAEAYILYYLDDSSFGQMTMALVGVVWTGIIPALPVGTNVTFEVHAKDTLGNWNVEGNFTYSVHYSSGTTTTTAPWNNTGEGIIYQIVDLIVSNIAVVSGGVILIIVVVVIVQTRKSQQYAAWESQF
jgi:parallel beta-helix repeat protein